MSVLVFTVTEQVPAPLGHQDPDGKITTGLKTYVLRIVPATAALSNRQIDNLLKSMVRQMTTRYEDCADLTVGKLVKNFDVQVWRANSKTSWPYWLGRVHKDRFSGKWSW